MPLVNFEWVTGAATNWENSNQLVAAGLSGRLWSSLKFTVRQVANSPLSRMDAEYAPCEDNDQRRQSAMSQGIFNAKQTADAGRNTANFTRSNLDRP